jgi:glycosyltransferase involved in cell wall biosynthesis
VTVESDERPVAADPARPAPRVGMIAYFFPPVGGVAVARTLGSVRYLPDAGWTPVVIAPVGSTYHLTDAAGLATLPAGLEVERARTFEPGHLRRLIASFRGRGATAGATAVAPAPVTAPATPSAAPATAAPRANAGLTWPARIRRTLWFPDDQLGWIPSAVRAVGRAHARAPLAALHSSSSPISAHVAAAIASRRLGIPWVADFRDPWVENPVDPPMGRIDAWRRRTLEAWVIRTADRVTFATPSLHDAYVRRYPGRAERFQVIENGYDRSELPSLPSSGAAPDELRRLVYAGSLYRPGELATFLDGVAALLDRRPEASARLRIEFIGSATDACKAVASARLARADLGSVVTFTAFLPRAEALRRLAAADAALTLLGPGPGMEQFIGAKLYDAIGLDRPVVAMLPPGDAREVLAGLDWGIVCDPEPTSVAAALERFLAAPPPGRRADPDGRYDRAMLARRLGAVLDDLRDAVADRDRA